MVKQTRKTNRRVYLLKGAPRREEKNVAEVNIANPSP